MDREILRKANNIMDKVQDAESILEIIDDCMKSNNSLILYAEYPQCSACRPITVLSSEIINLIKQSYEEKLKQYSKELEEL